MDAIVGRAQRSDIAIANLAWRGEIVMSPIKWFGAIRVEQDSYAAYHISRGSGSCNSVSVDSPEYKPEAVLAESIFLAQSTSMPMPSP